MQYRERKERRRIRSSCLLSMHTRQRPRQPGRSQSLARCSFTLLSRSNMFAHTRAKGHERPRIVFVHAHIVIPQKSSSNPALPCSALRIKAFPSSPIKFLVSLYRDKRQEGCSHRRYASALAISKASGDYKSSLVFERQTYLIFVSPPLTRRASAIAVMPSSV